MIYLFKKSTVFILKINNETMCLHLIFAISRAHECGRFSRIYRYTVSMTARRCQRTRIPSSDGPDRGPSPCGGHPRSRGVFPFRRIL